MLDNVRRGGELVGGQGAAAPDFIFALVHRLRRWRSGRLERFFEGGKQLHAMRTSGSFRMNKQFMREAIGLSFRMMRRGAGGHSAR